MFYKCFIVKDSDWKNTLRKTHFPSGQREIQMTYNAIHLPKFHIFLILVIFFEDKVVGLKDFLSQKKVNRKKVESFNVYNMNAGLANHFAYFFKELLLMLTIIFYVKKALVCF